MVHLVSQDLSVAGKRAGLAGERSGLFMEQIRLIKEMRENDKRNGRTNEHIRPRWMVWENVCGAYSSNKGADFQAVLTEIVRIAEPDAPDVPMPPKGKWPHAGELHDEMGRWSVAWRTHDAQYWGVPQRRKRISVVFDGGGILASKVLFDEHTGAESGSEIQPITEGLPRDTEQGEAQRKETAGSFGKSPSETEREAVINVFGICSYDSNAMKSSNPNSGIYEADTSRTLDNNGGNPACNQGGMAVLYDAYQHHGYREGETCGTLTAGQNNTVRGDTPLVYDARGNGDGKTVPTLTGDHQNRITDYTAITYSSETYDKWKENEVGSSLRATGGMYQGGSESLIQEVTGPLMASGYNKNGTQEAMNGMYIQHTCGAICADDFKGANNQDVEQGKLQIMPTIVRRLTPTECESLQGFPRGWTDIGEWTDSKGKKHKEADSPRYKALGNSIALPFWYWLLKRISATYSRTPYLGSLFDGIGGFPLCWERCNGKGTASWASEIEEFPIAVTKMHFGEE